MARQREIDAAEEKRIVAKLRAKASRASIAERHHLGYDRIEAIAKKHGIAIKSIKGFYAHSFYGEVST